MATPLPAAYNTSISTLLIGANIPGQPSGVLYQLPFPFPFLLPAAPAGATLPVI